MFADAEIVEADAAGPVELADLLEIAAGLRLSMSLLGRRLRLVQPDGELTVGEIAALVRLERGGPTTAAALAKQETISPQSMGATLGGLEGRGLVERRPDPDDGRRVILSLADAGREALRDRRNARSEQLARALSSGFDDDELACLKAAAPLLERLAQRI
ncbi:MarR family transcriptional regulator [Parafrankia sp. FMc6]|uniref:MarR family winged helix-turn-helix transcriptional regulator n=1 Tax=Parafrankia soli TaxID=2599596 RepID=UPI0034D4C2F9